LNSEEFSINSHKPDVKEKIFFFVSGVIISVPFTIFFGTFADYLCVLFPVFYARLCSVTLFTPFIEEFAKIYPLFYRHGETQYSIFILAFLTGIGFGLAEFLLYVFFLDAPVFVRLPGLFFHAATTSIVAYGLASGKIIPFYLFAVFLHFSNNFFAFFGNLWYVGGGLTLFLTYYISWRLYRRVSGKIHS
jgi:hypothetical protein